MHEDVVIKPIICILTKERIEKKGRKHGWKEKKKEREKERSEEGKKHRKELSNLFHCLSSEKKKLNILK